MSFLLGAHPMNRSRIVEISAEDGSWAQIVEVAYQSVNHLTVRMPAPPPLGTIVRCRASRRRAVAARVHVVATNRDLVALRPRTVIDKRLLVAAASWPTRRRTSDAQSSEASSTNPDRRSISGEIEVPTPPAERPPAAPPKVEVCWERAG